MKNLRGRAALRGAPLDKDCYGCKTSRNEYGPDDNRVFCYGLIDLSTDEPIKKCKCCGAFVDNASPIKRGDNLCTT